MKISIIIPVYNAEKYVKKTIESVTMQSYRNLEIILINDGSKDDSHAICRDYAFRDMRIKLIDIENSGPGFARNIGLREASGEYICFVDADDKLEKNALETLLSIREIYDFDIVCGNHFKVHSTIKESRDFCETGEISREKNVRRFNSFKTSDSFGYVWAKLYKRKFLTMNNICFSEEREVFLEDLLFNLKCFAFTPMYYLINTPIYHYNVSSGSLSNRREDITHRSICFLRNYEKFLDTNDLYFENRDLFVPLSTRVIAWSLFKSMDYKVSLGNLISKTKVFSRDETVNRVFLQKRALREIITLNNILQRILYLFIIFSIVYKLDFLLSLVFFISYPLFKVYIRVFLRN